MKNIEDLKTIEELNKYAKALDEEKKLIKKRKKELEFELINKTKIQLGEITINELTNLLGENTNIEQSYADILTYILKSNEVKNLLTNYTKKDKSGD